MPTTTLIRAANVGDTVLYIPDDENRKFLIGDIIIIGGGSSFAETNAIIGFGSIILETPLIRSHPPGTLITGTGGTVLGKGIADQSTDVGDSDGISTKDKQGVTIIVATSSVVVIILTALVVYFYMKSKHGGSKIAPLEDQIHGIAIHNGDSNAARQPFDTRKKPDQFEEHKRRKMQRPTKRLESKQDVMPPPLRRADSAGSSVDAPPESPTYTLPPIRAELETIGDLRKSRGDPGNDEENGNSMKKSWANSRSPVKALESSSSVMPGGSTLLSSSNLPLVRPDRPLALTKMESSRLVIPGTLPNQVQVNTGAAPPSPRMNNIVRGKARRGSSLVGSSSGAWQQHRHEDIVIEERI